jgi:hypothetical protein
MTCDWTKNPSKRPRAWPAMPTRGSQFLESFGIMLPAVIGVVAILVFVTISWLQHLITP